jgi:HSP20 family protein
MPSYPYDNGLGLPRLAPFDALRRSIDQVFADFSKGVGFVPTPLDAARYDFYPHAELHDNGIKATIRIELPGVEPTDVSVQVTDDLIEVTGEKKSEFESRDGDRYNSERSFGTFYRAFTLPFGIDAERVEATLDKGVLRITMPVRPDDRSDPKRISISTPKS